MQLICKLGRIKRISDFETAENPVEMNNFIFGFLFVQMSLQYSQHFGCILKVKTSKGGGVIISEDRTGKNYIHSFTKEVS